MNYLRQNEMILADEEDLSPEPETRRTNCGFRDLMDSDSESDSDSDSNADNETDGKHPLVQKDEKKIEKQEKNDTEDDMKYLDRVIEEMKGLESRSGEEDNCFGIYLIDKKNLNGERELQKLFQMGGTRQQRSGLQQQRRHRKKTIIVDHVDDDRYAPPSFVAGGIRFVVANEPKSQHDWETGCDFFQIEWSANYEKIHGTYLELQNTFDPNNIAMFLQVNPYHIEALVQLSMVCQQHGQADQATEFIRRCLLIYEYAWMERYAPWNIGNIRMDITAAKNESYFQALFYHAVALGKKGCSKSAFQLFKLVWAMDPLGDPMGIVLRLDYFALIAGEYDFLIKWRDAKIPIGGDRRAQGGEAEAATLTSADLPNLSYSIALAYYWNGDKEQAMDTLMDALVAYPIVFRLLCDKCEFKGIPWRDLVSSSLFANAEGHVETPLGRVLRLYVDRNYTLWKIDEIRVFLSRAAERVIETQHRSRISLVDFSRLGKYRSIQDLTDQVVLLPEDQPQAMPPPEQRQAQGGQLRADTHPLLLLLQTLLPWNSIDPRNAGEQ